MAKEVDAPLSADEQAEVLARFEQGDACIFCAGLHDRVAGLQPHEQPCPRIKRIERHTDGTVLVVEFWRPGLWEANVLFASDIADDSA